MAEGKSGSFNATVNSFKVIIEWSEEYDVSTNKSKVSVDMFLYSDGWGGAWYPKCTITIDGQQIVEMDYNNPATHITAGEIYGAKQKVVNIEGSNGVAPPWGSDYEISHNSDGSKSVVISINNLQIYNAEKGTHTLGTISKSITLTQIARSSSITSVSNTTLGNKCNVKWTPNATSFRYKLKFSLGTWSKTTDTINPSTLNEYTYNVYTIPKEVANQIPNTTTGTMTVTLYTYSDSGATTQVGSASSKTFTVSIPEDIKPTINSSSIGFSVDNSGNSTISNWGVAVAGYTKINITAEATGSYGSTISGYTISDGCNASQSGTKLSFETTINTSGTKTFKVVAKDSRGRFSDAVESTEFIFYPYSTPSIGLFTANRSTSDQSKVIVKSSWSFASVNGKNAATGKLKYKKSSETAWSEAIELTSTTTTLSNFDFTTSYTFQLEVTDSLENSVTAVATISTGTVLLDFRAGGTGLGIGKICESDNSMVVALNAHFDNYATFNGYTRFNAQASFFGNATFNVSENSTVTFNSRKGSTVNFNTGENTKVIFETDSIYIGSQTLKEYIKSCI